MTINWFFLLASAALLWWPTPLWLGSNFTRPDRNHQPRVADLFLAWQNWVDLARSGAGAYLLRELSITVSSDAPQLETNALIIRGSILTVGLLLQIFGVRKDLFLLAPVFYLNGISLFLGDYASGGFAVTAGWMFALAGRNLRLQLPVMAVALPLGSFLLGGINSGSMLNFALVILPLLLSLLLQKSLYFVSLTRL
jgi:hypothetical protein